ncbi:glycoside hydrolase family 18 protein, partial [Francisella philomiragia]
STISLDIPKDGTVWKASVDAISGFKAVISPASFTANNDAQNIDVSFEQSSSDSKWPDRVVVGYVKGYDSIWYSQPDTTNKMVSEAMDHGYNVLAYAFAGQSKDGNVFFTSWTNEQIRDLPNQIKTIHDKYGIALLSIGGAENYFEPDMTTDANAENTGKAMGKFLADNGFDGLDIDVEHPTNGAEKDENFLNYIEATRAEFKSITGKDMFLTAAPQVTGWYGTGPWASGEAHFAESTYSQNFMDNAHFNAIFVQTYNQYGGANLCGFVGTDTGFLSCAFKLLTEEGQKDMPGISGDWHVPAETKLVLGVPDFKDPSVSAQAYKQGTCLADASCSGAGIYDPAEFTKDVTAGSLSSYNQYGGSMTWIMNSDAYQNWSWVDGVKNASYN